MRAQADAARKHYGELPFRLGAVARGDVSTPEDVEPIAVGDKVQLGPVAGLTELILPTDDDAEFEVTPSLVATFIKRYKSPDGDAARDRATVSDVISRQAPQIVEYRAQGPEHRGDIHSDYQQLFHAFASNKELFADIEQAIPEDTALALVDIAVAIGPLLNNVEDGKQDSNTKNYLIGGSGGKRSLIAGKLIEQHFNEQLKADPEAVVDGVLELLESANTLEDTVLDIETMRALELLTVPFAAEALSKRNDRIREQMNEAYASLTIETRITEAPKNTIWDGLRQPKSRSLRVTATDEHSGEGLSPYQEQVAAIREVMNQTLLTGLRLDAAFSKVGSLYYNMGYGVKSFVGQGPGVDYYPQLARLTRLSSVISPEGLGLSKNSQIDEIPKQLTTTDRPGRPSRYSALPTATPTSNEGYVRYAVAVTEGTMRNDKEYDWKATPRDAIRSGSVTREQMDGTLADGVGKYLAAVDRVWTDVFSGEAAPEIASNLAELDYRLAGHNLETDDALLSLLTPRDRHLEFVARYLSSDQLADSYLDGVVSAMGLDELFTEDLDPTSLNDHERSVLVASGFIYSLWQTRLEQIKLQNSGFDEQTGVESVEDLYLGRINELVASLTDEQRNGLIEGVGFAILDREFRQFLAKPTSVTKTV